MILTSNPRRFPWAKEMPIPCDVFDARGQEIDGQIVYVDTVAGEVGRLMRDEVGYKLDCMGNVPVWFETYPAPLRVVDQLERTA